MTKKELGILRWANRKCGLSYRSACKKGISIALELKKNGYLTLHDNGRDRGRFTFRTTAKGRSRL